MRFFGIRGVGIMAQIQYGMNINGHPTATFGRPANPAEMQGIAWIRVVFLLHAAVESPNNPRNIFGYNQNNPTEYADSLQRAFTYYDCLINSYARHGIRTLLILNQEKFFLMLNCSHRILFIANTISIPMLHLHPVLKRNGCMFILENMAPLV